MLKITRNQTPTFFATLATADGKKFDVTDYKSGVYTVYKSLRQMLSSVPNQYLEPVEGFDRQPVPVDAIIAVETVESSELPYNFKFAPDARESFPFPDVGIYFVEFQVTPIDGNPIVWQRTIQVV